MKLGIGSVLAEAIAFVWRARVRLVLYAIPFVSFTYAVDYFLDASAEYWMRQFMSGSVIGSIAVHFIFPALLYLAATTIFSVAWHRLYFLGEHADRFPAAAVSKWHYPRFYWNYVKFTILVVVIYSAMTLPVGLLMGLTWNPSSSTTSLIILVITQGLAVLAIAWIFVRMSLSFPAVALGEKLDLMDGYALSEGNALRLFAIVALSTVPLWVLNWALGFFGANFGFAPAMNDARPAVLGIELVRAILGFAGIALGVSVLSVAYLRVVAARPIVEET